MATQGTRKSRQGSTARAETINDLLVVSSFGLWAVLLGFAPVMAIRLLIGS